MCIRWTFLAGFLFRLLAQLFFTVGVLLLSVNNFGWIHLFKIVLKATPVTV
jgi:hypothetical protein